MPNTETDLRNAFAALALDHGAEPDVTDLRVRLASLTVDDVGVSTNADDDAEVDDAEVDYAVVDIDTAPGTSRRTVRRNRLLLLTAAAAIVALLAGLASVLLPDSPRKPIDPADKLREIGGPQFPGTIAEAYAHGKGPRTLSVPTRAIPDGFEREILVTCDGAGDMPISGTGVTVTCGADSGADTSVLPDRRSIRVRARATTTWQVVFKLTPQIRTNGAVAGPVDPELAAASPGRDVTAGRGNGTATAPTAAAPKEGYEMLLTCTGTGVSVPGTKSTETANRTGETGLYTKTCFAGFQYVWNGVSVRPGQRVTVQASPNTSWRILFRAL